MNTSMNEILNLHKQVNLRKNKFLKDYKKDTFAKKTWEEDKYRLQAFKLTGYSPFGSNKINY